MNDKVKEHIDSYRKQRKWPPCEAPTDYVEVLTECKILVEVARDEHRWYFVVTQVVELNGMFIQFDAIEMKGEDATAEDCGLEFDMDRVFEVEPYERTVTAYRRMKSGGCWSETSM